MSHVVTEGILITDLRALAAAAAECGLELVEGQTTFRWYGRFVGDTVPDSDPQTWGTCAHAIRVKGKAGAYEIGVVKVEGGYRLRYDAWMGGYGLEVAAGAKLGKLRLAYGLQAAERKLKRQGYTVQRKIGKLGRVDLVAVKG